MKNDQFLQNYQFLQYGIMFDKLINLDFASIVWCKKYDSSFFNYAQVNTVISEEQLKYIEKEMLILDRESSIYFESTDELLPLGELLKNNGYKKSWEDSWMFHSGQISELMSFDFVSKVLTESQLDTFIDVFDRCYQDNDPKNPYGTLGEYLEVARESWRTNASSGKIEYFIVYKDTTPVAVSTLTNFAGIGYISNVGSLQEVRGEGFGKIASLFCVKHSRENGNKVHALATEDGQYSNSFYKKIGFETKFTALGFSKDK